MQSVSLDGQWELSFLPHRGGVCATSSGTVPDGATTIPCSVPGNVEIDLMRAGLLPDLYVAGNIGLARTYEAYEWWYRRTFATPPDVAHAHRVLLVFHGIDCVAEVWLNGRLVARPANMLIEHRMDVTGLLRATNENELTVRILPATIVARAHTYDPCEAAGPTNWEANPIRKAAHMYGWDIAPRLVSAGLWRSVHLELHEPTELLDLYYHTAQISGDSAALAVSWQFATDALDLSPFRLRFTGACGDSAFTHEVAPLFTAGATSIHVPNPRLWWPRGYGDPDLYSVTCELLREGQVVDSRTDRIGIRQILLERTDTAGDDGQFIFRVNGTPILVKGANWVPADAIHSRDAERYAPALALFEDLGCNMLRSWGGGVYEDHAFFDLCDEKGIMVWQDFAFACARYPQTEEFLATVRREAEAVVRKLRNHPSLAVWCADNEVDDSYVGAGLDPAHNRISRQVLPQVVHRCDPHRPYVPGSPYHSSEKVRRNDARLMPEQHLWGPRDYFKSRFYTESTAHFIGEIGYHGCPNASSMRRFLSPDKVWPWRSNPEWRLHCTDPVPGGSGYGYRVELMANQIAELFGRTPEGLDEFVLASQISQAEAKKFFVEMVRLRKWRRTGLLWWNVIDCWPQFSDAVVDYYFGKKLAYWYLKRVQQPVCLMVDEPEDWHVRVVMGNDSRRAASGPFRVWDADTGQTLLQGTYATEPNTNQLLGRIRVSRGSHSLFLMEWEDGGRTLGNHYLLGSPPFDFHVYRRWLTHIAALPNGFNADAVGR